MTHDILMLIIIVLIFPSFYFCMQWIENKTEIQDLKSQLKLRPDVNVGTEEIIVTHQKFGRVESRVYRLVNTKKDEEQS